MLLKLAVPCSFISGSHFSVPVSMEIKSILHVNPGKYVGNYSDGRFQAPYSEKDPDQVIAGPPRNDAASILQTILEETWASLCL